MKRRILLSAACILFTVALVVTVTGCLMSQPSFRSNQPSSVSVAPDYLRSHVEMLSETFYPRDWENEANLSKCADYIGAHFTNAGAVVQFQAVPVHGRQYRNVIARFGVGNGSKLVVGAHYDAYGDTPGADDNASGVAALIELSYLLGRNPPEREIELVAREGFSIISFAIAQVDLPKQRKLHRSLRALGSRPVGQESEAGNERNDRPSRVLHSGSSLRSGH